MAFAPEIVLPSLQYSFAATGGNPADPSGSDAEFNYYLATPTEGDCRDRG